MQITDVSSNTTLNATHCIIFADASGGDITLTLPAVADSTRRFYIIKKIDSSNNTVTIDGNSTELIDSAETDVLYFVGESRFLACNGTLWRNL